MAPNGIRLVPNQWEISNYIYILRCCTAHGSLHSPSCRRSIIFAFKHLKIKLSSNFFILSFNRLKCMLKKSNDLTFLRGGGSTYPSLGHSPHVAVQLRLALPLHVLPVEPCVLALHSSWLEPAARRAASWTFK